MKNSPLKWIVKENTNANVAYAMIFLIIFLLEASSARFNLKANPTLRDGPMCLQFPFFVFLSTRGNILWVDIMHKCARRFKLTQSQSRATARNYTLLELGVITFLFSCFIVIMNPFRDGQR